MTDEHGGPAPALTHAVTVRAGVTAWDRWLARCGSAILPIVGAAVLQVAVEYRAEVPLTLWALGAALLGLGSWLGVLVWRAGRETLCVAEDGSLHVSSPALFRGVLVVDKADVRALSFADGINVPVKAVALGFFTRGDYLRIDLTQPRRLPHTRWTNYLWAARERSDPWPVPLRHRQVRSLGFSTTRAEADKVLRQAGC